MFNQFIDSFKDQFQQNFIEQNRWEYLWKGLGTTVEIAFFAAVIGIVLGFIIAIVRSSYDKMDNKKHMSFISRFFFGFANMFCKFYLTIFRGTPVVVQLLIIYFVIFSSVNINKVLVAIIAFGLNSGAYVAEIVRSGIMSIDNGQFEAGRSLGLSYPKTLRYIIVPQAFKNVLPALANEFIVLLKETSVSGYIALNDLTKGGDIIRSITYSPFFPLIAVALIYLVLVLILQKGVSLLERRLRNSDH